MRHVTLVIAACLLAGCARDVVMLNARTGDAVTCHARPLNPWSQQEACIGDLIGQGWKRLVNDEANFQPD